MHNIETGIGQKHCIRVGEADVFGCQYAEPPGNKKRVFTGAKHPCQIIYGSVGIRASDAFYKGAYHVLVHLALFVVDCNVFFQAVAHNLVAYYNLPVF